MFEDRTTENLKKETLAEIEPATGVSSMAGSYADATVGPLCQAVSRLYKALPGVLSMLFVDESSGRFLDLVGGDYFDLTRREGTKARCSVTLVILLSLQNKDNNEGNLDIIIVFMLLLSIFKFCKLTVPQRLRLVSLL